MFFLFCRFESCSHTFSWSFGHYFSFFKLPLKMLKTLDFSRVFRAWAFLLPNHVASREIRTGENDDVSGDVQLKNLAVRKAKAIIELSIMKYK